MRAPSVFSDTSLSPSFLRTTPAKNPRTECGCQPVEAMMPAMVAPPGRRSRPRTRACFESARVLRRPIILPGAAFERTFAADRVFAVRLCLLVDMPKLLSIGAAQQRAATTQTPRRPKGAGGGEERAGQARATMHAPFKRQVERKMAPGEGLFSLRLPKFESYQPGILNSLPPCCSTLPPPQCQRSPCRSCTLATPQLGREPSLLRHFGQIGTNSPGNAGGF